MHRRQESFLQARLKCLTILTLWLSTQSYVYAQNLVPNPSFEEIEDCVYMGDMDGPMPCIPWFSRYSCNYFNACHPDNYGVPYNFKGFQYPKTGDAYIGGYQNAPNTDGGGEWPYVQLTEEMVQGQCYEISYWASVANESCPIDRLGAALVDDVPLELWPGTLVPQIDVQMEYFSDTLEWMLVSADMIAMGGEEYLFLGNFYEDDETGEDPFCTPSQYSSYYYFDEVSVVAVETFPISVDLGGPYESCFPIILDAQNPGASYLWSDGSTDQILIATTSGTYSVVVSFGNCTGGVGVAEVVILETHVVDAGPDYTLCEGETYLVDLDENLGEYIWQDGSVASEYLISTPGVYSVTMDDGCLISTDEIGVTGDSIPAFSLGPDGILCEGEELTLNLNPFLGDFTWQDQSANSYFQVESPGTYALTITNTCGTFSDEIDFAPGVAPSFDLGTDVQFLCPDSTIQFALDPALGDFLWQDGSMSAEYNIQTTGAYSLTVSNVCGTDEDAITVMSLTPPSVDLSFVPNQLCPGETTLIDLSYNEGDFLWNTGSTDPAIAISTSGFYAVTISNACGVASDQVQVDVTPDIYPPDLGPDTILCSVGGLMLEVNQPDAQILWSDFSTEQYLNVTSSGTYSVFIYTICESYYDTIDVVMQNLPPVVSLPDQVLVCDGHPVVIDAGVSNVSYLWSDGSILPQISVSLPGEYAVTVSNDCGTDADTVVVIAGGPAPLIGLGMDTMLCPGDSLLLKPVIANVDVWFWPDGTIDSTFMVFDSGQIILLASNACTAVSDTILIQYPPDLPTIDLGADTLVCPGQIIELNLMIPDVQILWPDGSMQQQYVTSDSGVVIVNVSDQCRVSSDSLHIGWLPEIPALELGDDLALCPGETIIISPGLGAVSYVWHDDSTLDEYQVTQPGLISVTITNACGNAMDSIVVLESNLGPQLELGPDLKGCEGDTVFIASGISGVQYQWQDGSSEPFFQAVSSGTYSLSVSNACGTDSDSIEVTISGSPPMTTLGPDTILCIGNSLLLSGSPDMSHVWQDGSLSETFLVTSTGLYMLTESNDCGSDNDSILVNIDGIPPQPNLGADTSVCAGSVLILSGTQLLDISYQWQDGSEADTFEVTSSGVYILMETNRCGIENDTIVVTMDGTPPVTDLGADAIVCAGSSILLTPSDDQSITNLWQDGTESHSYVVSEPGIYSVFQSNSCDQDTDSIQIDFIESPMAFDLGPDTIICAGDLLVLSAPAGMGQLEWQDGTSASTMLVEVAGVYSLSVSNECGSAADEIIILTDDRTPQLELDTSFNLCPGESLTIDVTQHFPAVYSWGSGDISPLITVVTPDTYIVTILTECATTVWEFDVMRAQDCNEANFFFPNIFSPNGDQVNDEVMLSWTPDVDVLGLTGRIYDRWGGLMFESDQIPFRWDGLVNELGVLPGVYLYTIQVRYKVAGPELSKIISGEITVIW